MTFTERKRAVRLEKTARMYGSMGSVNKMLAFLTIAVLIIDIALFPTASPDDQLAVIFFVHGFFLSMFSALVVIMNTHPVGSTGYLIETGTYVSDGFSYSEKFLCILPFEAKDLLNLNLISFEKQLAVVTGSTVFLQITAVILRTSGFIIEDVYIGIGCFAVILYEALLLAVSLTRMRSYFAIGIMQIPMIPLTIFCIYLDGLSEEEATVKAMEMFSPLDIFSGVPGIIVMVTAAAAMIFIGELCLKHKSGVSWDIK